MVSASGTSSLPFFKAPGALSYGIEGVEIPEELSPHTSLRSVLPGYFETMGIGSWDLPTYSLSGGTLLLLSLFASYLPARRAGTVPPMEVLKEE